MPGVKLGLKDHLQDSRTTAQSSLEYFSYAAVILAFLLMPWIYSSCLPVRVIIVPTGTKSVCETL